MLFNIRDSNLFLFIVIYTFTARPTDSVFGF